MGAFEVTASVAQRKSLGEEIVEVLQRDIIGGGFRPGERLLERELIKRFGVSSIPIREALQELENRGLVVRRRNCGCSVIQLSPKEAARICELRRLVEPKVMEWAAERITPAAGEQLWEQLERIQLAAEAQDLAAYFQEDLKLHRMIWELADNVYATRMLETAIGPLFASGIIGSREFKTIDIPATVENHRRLLSAICDGDRQRAALSLLEVAAEFETHLAKI
jgi:DNA-binding GntR family transcriptional regulator